MVKTLCCVLLLIGYIYLQGCSKKTSDSTSYDRDKNLALVDQGFYDEAIFSLSNHVALVPEDTEARLLLASALAAKSGIILKRFGNLARILLTSSEANT